MRFLNLGSIRKNLTLLVFLTVLPAMAILFYSGIEERRTSIAHAKEDVSWRTHAIAQKQEDMTLSARDILSTLALMNPVQNLDVQACNDIFKNLLSRNPNYNNIALVDLSGDILAAGIFHDKINIANRKHIRDALKTKKFATGEYAVAHFGNPDPIFPFACPVFDTTGNLKAALSLTVNLSAFPKLYFQEHLPENSFIAVTDHQGVRLSYYPAKSITNPIGKPIKASNWKIAKHAQKPRIITAIGSDGTRQIMAFEPIRLNANANPYMYIWTGVPETFFLAPANAILQRNLLLMLLATIASLFVSWSLSRRTLISPINQLINMTSEFAKGNLESRIEPPARIDEFSKLTESFHLMAEFLSLSKEKLQNSEARFKKLSGVTLEGILIHKKGIVIDANDTLTKLFGYTHEEVISNNLIELLFPGESHPTIREKVSKEIETPYEVLARKKDGTLFTVEIESRNITEGAERYRVTSIRDITERKQVEEALTLSHVIFEKLTNSAKDGIIQINHEGNVVFWNLAATEIFGYDAEEMIGTNLHQVLVSERDQERYQQAFPEFLHTGKGNAVGKLLEVEGIHKNGQKVPLGLSLSSFDLHGNRQAMAVIRDISERKKAEQQRLDLEAQLRQKYKMDSVGVMAGGMAHNFNNNLSIILGNIELTKMELAVNPKIGHAVNSKIGHYLGNAKIGVLRSRDLIQQILIYSRQEIKEKTSIQLPLVIDEALQLLSSTLPSTINVQQKIGSDSHNFTINADSSQIQECLINLCNNSMHAMDEEGELTISLESVELHKHDIPAQYDSRPGRYAKLSVQDTGCGMSAETVDKIFDLFFTTKPVDRGTGIGLSTVQGIIQQHGGFIKVNSILGKGTTFELYFPIIERQLRECAETNCDLPRGTEHILFVDDDAILAELGEEMLTLMGYKVTTMTDSSEALKLFAANANAFQLVITDQTMPELTGMDFVQAIKQIRPDIPSILCTGYSTKIDAEKAKDLGVSAFLMKPLELPELLQTMRQVLDGEKG